MASYGRKIPNPLSYGPPHVGPVAQQTEHSPPKRVVAGATPAGLTPQDRLRAARHLPGPDRQWEAIRARLEWIDTMVALGVPEGAAFIADGRMQRAKRLPRSRYLAAAKAIGAYMHTAKMRASGAAKVWVH